MCAEFLCRLLSPVRRGPSRQNLRTATHSHSVEERNAARQAMRVLIDEHRADAAESVLKGWKPPAQDTS